MAQRPATRSTNKSKVSAKWLNNVMKSIGAASVDSFKDIAPNLSEIGKGAAGAVRSIKDVTRGNNVSQVSKSLSNNTMIKSVKKAFNNSLNDLKTGKIYNTERLSQMEDEMFEDFESGFSFDGFDNESEDATVTFNYIDEGKKASSSGNAILADAITSSAESNVKAQKASVDAMISIASAGMLQSQEIAKETNMHLSNINNGISAIVQFQQENTLKFYESAMAVFDRYAKVTESNDKPSRRSSGPDIFNSSKGIDAAKYKDYVKKQIKNTYKNSAGGSALDMLTDSSMIDLMLSNPIGGATKFILSAMTPKLVTETVKGMEDAFKGFMPTMLAKLGDWRKSEEAGMKGALQRLIGNVFGIKVDTKKGFDLSGKVTKDAAIFDGVTRNTIVEIIPKHLREMSSYLKDIAEHFKIDTKKSRDNSEVFDIESNSYMKVKDVRKSLADEITEGISDAFKRSEFGEGILAGGSKLAGQDVKTYERMSEQMFQAITRMEKALTPEGMNIHDKNSDINQLKKYIDVNSKHDEKILKVLMNTIDLMKKNQVGVQHAAKAQMDAKVAYNNTLNELSDNYDTRNLLAAGITEDTNPWELVDKEKGNKNSQKMRKKREEQKKKAERERKKYEKANRAKGSARELAKGGLEQGNIIPDNDTIAGRRKGAVKNADASTVPGLIANAGTHTKNGMFAIMNGDSKTAMKEFASIFSDSMKTFWGSIKDNFLNPLKESIFGKKDENGYLQGGMFTAIQNKSKDIWHEMGSKIKGTDWTDADGNVHKGDKENSVLGKVSSVFKELGNSVRYRLFGEKDKDGKDGAEKKGVIGGIVDSLKLGLQGWKDTLFGTDDPEKSGKEMAEDFKKKAMDAIPTLGVGALAGLGTSLMSGGLLGAMVGGPMTGIILGMGTSLLTRSEKFKDYMFGPEVEDENGNKTRIGGLVSQKTQEMFKDPKLKKSIIGGAAIGLAKNVVFGSSGGLMGALVGGPFAGAILGGAVGFLKESQMFKDFMYGNEEKGIEGFKTKLTGKIKKTFGATDDEDTKDFKKRMGMGAIGATGGGLMGFMMGGPILGALGGLALGVKSSGKNFQKWLFGEKDENGKKTKEGMVGKVANFMHVEVMAPMKTKFLGIAADFKNTMKNKVFKKLTILVDPLVEGFKSLADKVKEGMKKGGGLIKKIMAPIANVAKKVVFNPLRKVVSGVTSLAYKSAKAMITVPVKILEVTARAITSPFKKAADKITEAVGKVKDFTMGVIKKAYSNTFGKLFNLAKAGLSYGKDKLKNKASNAGYKVMDKLSGGRIKGKEGMNKLKEKLGFGGFRRDLDQTDIDYLKQKKEDKEKLRHNKAMDKNRALVASTLGYDVKYFDEKSYNAAIAKDKRLKNKFKKIDGKLDFETSPEDAANKMKEAAQKLSDDDILTAKSSDLGIEGRQLQQMTRAASFLERISSFLTGDKPQFGVGDINKSDGAKKEDVTKETSKEKTTDEKDSNDEEKENKEEKAISKIDELKAKFEEAGGFFNYIKNTASEKFHSAKNKTKTAFSKVKGFFSRKGKARANGGDVDEGESYLVGDGGSDPNAAEIFTPKTKGKVLSQKGNGIKVFIQGISSKVIKKLKGEGSTGIGGNNDDGNTVGPNPVTPEFGGGLNGIKNRLQTMGIAIPAIAGNTAATKEDDSEADDIAVAKTNANSEADYDEKGNLIEEKADTSDIDDIKDGDAKKDAIIDADNASDLINAKNKGSFESQRRKKDAEKETEKDKEQKSLLGAIRDKVGEGNEQSKSHFLSWDNIFSKKGLITAGLLLLMAKFPGIWETLKNILESVGKGLGMAVGNTVDQSQVLDGIGAQKDNNGIAEQIKENAGSIVTNPLGLDEDGSTTGSSHERGNLIAKLIIDYTNRYNSSVTKGTKKTKKVMRGVEKVIKAPGRAVDRVVNGKPSEYKKFTRDKKKNHLHYDKKTKTYTDLYDRKVIDKDQWEEMKKTKGSKWIEENKKNYYVPGDDSFKVNPNKKETKFSKWKDKKKKKIKNKWNESKPGKVINQAKESLENAEDNLRNKAKDKWNNSKPKKAVDNHKVKKEAKRTAKGGTLSERIENKKQEAKEFIQDKGKTTVEKMKQESKELADKLKDKAKNNKEGGGLFKKVCGMIEEFFSNLLSKLADKSGKKPGKIKTILNKFGPKQIIEMLKSKFPKITEKVTRIMTKGVTVGSFTFGLSEVVFAAGGAIDGATCASKLFKVSKEDTDWVMRLIGAAWGLCTGTTVGAIVDVVLDVLEPLNARDVLLGGLYNFFKNDGGKSYEKLRVNQKKFLKVYETDQDKKIKAQWETQKKAGIIGEDVSYEQFKDGVEKGTYKIDKEDFDTYNTRVNGGISDKVGGAVSKAVGWVGHRGKDALFGKEAYQDDKGNTYKKNDDGSWQVTDKDGKDLGYVNKDAIDTSKMKDVGSGGLVGGAKKVITGAIDKGKELASGAINGAKKFFGGVGNFLFGGGEEENQPAKVDKNTSAAVPGGANAKGSTVRKKATPKKTFGGFVGKVLDSGAFGIIGKGVQNAGAIVDAVKNPKETIKKVANGIHNFFTSEKEEIYRNPKDNSYYRSNGKKGFDLYNVNGQKISKKPISSKEVLTAIQAGTLVKDTLTTRESGLSKKINTIKKNASKVINNGIKALGKLGNGAKKLASNVWKGVKNVGGKIADGAKKVANGVYNFFTSEKEEIYRNPKDNSYYRSNGKKGFDLYNVNGQKISKKPISSKDIMKAVQAGTLVKDTLTTRESGISKTISSIGKGLANVRDKVVGGIKTGFNNIKKFGVNLRDKAMEMGKNFVNKAKEVGTEVKNFFMDSKQEVFASTDGTYYEPSGKCFSQNGERLKSGDISQKELMAKVKAGELVKTVKIKKSGIKKLAGRALDVIKGGIKKGWENLKNFGNNVRDKAMEMGKTFVNGVKNAATATKNFFVEHDEDVFIASDGSYYNSKGECFNKNDERLKSGDIKQKELEAKIKAGVLVKQTKHQSSGISKLAKGAWDKLTDGIKKGWNAIKNFGNNVRDKAMEMGKTFVNGVKNAAGAVKNFFVGGEEEVFVASDGTYYNSKGECFNKNDERLKSGDIPQKEVIAKVKAGVLVKQTKKTDSGIKKLATGAWNKLTDGIKKGWNAIKNFGNNIRDKAMEMGKTFVNGVKNAATATKNFFVGHDEDVFIASDGSYYNSKGECFNKNDERLKSGDISQKELEAKIKAGVLVKQTKHQSSGISKLAKGAWDKLTGGIKKGWEGLKSLGKGVAEKFGELKDDFVEFAKDPIGSVKSFFTSTKKKGYMSPSGDYYIAIKGGWEHYNAAGDLLEKITDKKQVSDIWKKIDAGVLKETEITEKSGLKKVGEKIQDLVSSGWEKAKDGASAIWSGITGLFTGGNGEDVSQTAAKISDKSNVAVPGVYKNVKNNKNIKNADDKNKKGGNGDAEIDENGGNGEEVNGFSYFSQKDKKWRGKQYASKDGKYSSSMGKSGCGPTAFAMVANQLKGGKIDPMSIASDATESGFRDETGTNAKFIDYEADRYGLDATSEENPSAEYITKQLDAGRPMILNGIKTGSGKSAYTKSGHYIVAVGRDKNGNILINDPRGKKKSKPISVNDLVAETRIGWTFDSPNYRKKKISKKVGGHGENTFTAEDVINIAKGEVGYSEKKSPNKLEDKKANAGDKNYTKYAKGAGHANGNAWCATFVVWCFTQAANGDKKKAKEVLCGANTAGCSNNVSAFKKAGRYDMKPQPGDVVFFMNGSSHTGLVIAVKGNTITTIEGNTSPGKFNRDGGCVAQKSYNYKTYHRISGFGHPKYDGTSTFNGEVGTAEDSDSESTTSSDSSSNAVTSFTDKFTNLFSQYAEKAMTGLTTGKWDYTFNADGSDSTSTDSSSSDDGSPSDSEATSDGKVDLTISGKNKSEKVWNFFKNNGFSDAATAGILGNMYQESGVEPGSIQGGGKGPAAGIFQWENYNTKTSRFGNLYKRAKKRGKSWKDLATQLEYALDEMKSADLNKRFAGKIGYLKDNPWTKVDIDNKKYSAKPVKGGFEGYKQMDNAEEAVKTFEAAYERAGKPNFKRRIAYAKTMMNKYSGKTGGNGEGDETENYLNETSERYFNPQYKKTNTFDVDRTVHVNTTNRSGNNVMNVFDTRKLEEILQKAVSVLESIDKSTSSSQKELKNLSSSSNNQMNNITNNNIYNTTNKSGTTPTGKDVNSRNSQLAEMLARG